jgi:hypothetical protein
MVAPPPAPVYGTQCRQHRQVAWTPHPPVRPPPVVLYEATPQIQYDAKDQEAAKHAAAEVSYAAEVHYAAQQQVTNAAPTTCAAATDVDIIEEQVVQHAAAEVQYTQTA